MLDYYEQHGTLHGISYPALRTNLATLKLRLMNLQNSHLGQPGDIIYEEMLASREVYQAFLQEQQLFPKKIVL